MKILAFDTCLDKMYVTVGEGKEVLCSRIVETTKTNYHSAYLISTIASLLEESNLTPQDIDVVATNIGPGRFTGIRACTTVARVMAQATNIKAVGVSSLEILSKINSTDKKTLVALDARKEMAYVSIFDDGNQILAPQVILVEELKQMIDKEDYFVVTDDKLQPILGGISYQKEPYDLVEFLLKIAVNKLEDTSFDTNWQKLLPLYIQPPALNVKCEKKEK